MAVHASHAALPYPIENARFTYAIPYLDADGDPTNPTTPDTEFSLDGGDFADCAEEVTTIVGANGMGLHTVTGAETKGSILGIAAKVASGPKATLLTLYPRVLAIVGSGTLSAGSAGGGTLGTVLAYDVTGCFLRTTGGTGGGGTGGANNQARKIVTYTPSTGAFTVSPNWETTTDNTTTYDVLLPEGLTLGGLRALNPATAGRTIVVDASGLADANAVKVGPTGAGTAQTASDLAATLGVAGAGLTALPLTAANFATDTLAAAAASAGFANKLADHFWRRTFANAKASANGDAKAWRSGLGVMAKLVNKVALAAGILTAYEEDDATALGTQTATTDASADPVTGLDTV